MEQLQQEQSCQASEEEVPDGLFTTEETTTEVYFSQSVSYEKERESSIISGFKGQITKCKNSQIRFLCRHVPHFQLSLFQSTAGHFLVFQNVIIEMLWH
jgi:hypothetical protein